MLFSPVIVYIIFPQLIDGQQTLNQQQTFNQSLLTSNVSNQPTFNQLNYNQGQFTLQSQGNTFDVGSISSLTNNPAMQQASLSSTSMQNILQTTYVLLVFKRKFHPLSLEIVPESIMHNIISNN